MHKDNISLRLQNARYLNFKHAAPCSHLQPLEWPQVAAPYTSKRVAASGRFRPNQFPPSKQPLPERFCSTDQFEQFWRTGNSENLKTLCFERSPPWHLHCHSIWHKFWRSIWICSCFVIHSGILYLNNVE